jgi:hypothetical protein
VSVTTSPPNQGPGGGAGHPHPSAALNWADAIQQLHHGMQSDTQPTTNTYCWHSSRQCTSPDQHSIVAPGAHPVPRSLMLCATLTMRSSRVPRAMQCLHTPQPRQCKTPRAQLLPTTQHASSPNVTNARAPLLVCLPYACMHAPTQLPACMHVPACPLHKPWKRKKREGRGGRRTPHAAPHSRPQPDTQ